MAEYHLDTDTCSAALKGNANVQTRCLQHFGQLRVSAVVVAELYTAVFNSRRVQENLQKVRDLLIGIEVLPFDEEAATVCGEICADLIRRGLPTGEKDSLIAASARCRQAVLVTHNTRHFENIPGLILEDWVV